MTIQILVNESGTLNFSEGSLATREQYETADRCVGSIFEALEPGESVRLAEGIFCLDDDLDLMEPPAW